jgi:hypothetical protein
MREVYRRELIPDRMRWWLAAAGMHDFARVVKKELAPHVADSRALVSVLMTKLFERRWLVLKERFRRDDRRTMSFVFSALYRTSVTPRARWLFDDAGGPKSIAEHLRARVLIAPLTADDRWRELTTHLGELLIVMTEELPAHLPRSHKLLGDACFRMGEKYARRVIDKLGIRVRDDEVSPPLAVEILRMSEYIFRVNPEHWGEAKTETGWIEGTACPWYDRPGWNAAHCGIFGQFQAGISSVFGLKYRLSQTIPKHGGTTCRIDLVPLPTKRRS